MELVSAIITSVQRICLTDRSIHYYNMMINYDTGRLILKHIRKEITPTESVELQQWVESSEGNRAFFEKINTSDILMQHLHEYAATPVDSELGWNRLLSEAQVEGSDWAKPTVFRLRRFWGAAAAVLLLLIVSSISWFYLIDRKARQSNPDTGSTIAVNTTDIAPGSNKAVLVLANGQKVVLDSSAIGNKLNQGNSSVAIDENTVSYSDGAKGESDRETFNTISTPLGGQYQLQLPDGSKMWLNAGSSVRFPVSFRGNQRRIEVTGEIYCSIAHNANKPFIVTVRGIEVKVLGTEFNINAYADESHVRTSLINGSILVTSANARKGLTLKPGQEAVAEPTSGEIQLVKDANIEQAIAWKNGFFQFASNDIHGIMRQLSRWYNVTIIYKGEMPKRTFSGKIPRNMSAVKVLNLLRSMDVRFNIDETGKQITVLP